MKIKEIKIPQMLDKLKCKLGFHDFKYVGEDSRFMPKVLILEGKCSRCPETQNFFLFFESKTIVSRNFGIDRLFGERTIMPMAEKDLALQNAVKRG